MHQLVSQQHTQQGLAVTFVQLLAQQAGTSFQQANQAPQQQTPRTYLPPWQQTLQQPQHQQVRIQKWLAMVLHHPMPVSVDSGAVAGMVDLLRARGCFGLSARYVVCLGLSTSQIQNNMKCTFPPYSHFETIGNVLLLCLLPEQFTTMMTTRYATGTRFRPWLCEKRFVAVGNCYSC